VPDAFTVPLYGASRVESAHTSRWRYAASQWAGSTHREARAGSNHCWRRHYDSVALFSLIALAIKSIPRPALFRRRATDTAASHSSLKFFDDRSGRRCRDPAARVDDTRITRVGHFCASRASMSCPNFQRPRWHMSLVGPGRMPALMTSSMPIDRKLRSAGSSETG